MRLRFRCEMEEKVEVPTYPSAFGDYVEGCGCAMCVALLEKKEKEKNKKSDVPRKFNITNRGMVILESEPQFRTLFVYGNKGLMRLPFPYIVMAITYTIENGKYIYPGISGSGLRVFFRNSPMEKYTDTVSPASTDYNRFGLVCTPHGYDSSKYETIESMCNFVISTWWNMTHVLEYPEATSKDWPNFSLEKAIGLKWGNVKANTLLPFPDALLFTESNTSWGRGVSFNPPVDSVLINEPWGKQVVLKGL